MRHDAVNNLMPNRSPVIITVAKLCFWLYKKNMFKEIFKNVFMSSVWLVYITTVKTSLVGGGG